MSMNFFFKAFEAADLAAMQQDPALIDTWVSQERKFSAEMDVGTAWDVMQTALQGAGFECDAHADEALFNGAMLAGPASVAQQAQALAAWTPERFLEAVAELGVDTDLYHAEVWMDEDSPEELQAYFTQLQAFYAEAAAKQQGLVMYVA
jgi:hypothetical protein